LANPEKTKDDLKSYVLRFFTLNMALALIMSWVKVRMDQGWMMEERKG